MSDDTNLDLVTGAFSYSGSRIAEALLDAGRERADPHVSPRPRASAAGQGSDAAVSLRRPGRARPQPRGRDHALQHLLGPLRSRPDDVRRRDRERTHPVPRRPARRGGARRARQHREPLDRFAAALLPGEGARRAGARRGRPSLLDRQADVDLRRRARRAREQHRLDPAADADLRGPRRRRATPSSRCTSTTWRGSARSRLAPRATSSSTPRGRRRCRSRRLSARSAAASERARRSSTSRPSSCRPRPARSACSSATSC